MAGRVIIHDLDVEYDVSYRDVMYPRLEFKTGKLLLVLPRGDSEEEIIDKHREWIYEKGREIKAALEESSGKRLEYGRTEEQFRKLVYSLVESISKELDLKINKVFFRKMISKWGSCSSRRNLTINKLMRYLPKCLIEYVIYHEMVHLLERKHNKRFWSIVSSKFKNYQEYEKDLFVYWFLIQRVI